MASNAAASSASASASSSSIHQAPANLISSNKRLRSDNGDNLTDDDDRISTAEMQRWMKSAAVQNHLKMSISKLTTLFSAKKTAELAVEKLKSHLELGTFPPSMKVNRVSTKLACQESNKKIDELRNKYHTDVLKLTFEARTESLIDTVKKLTSFRHDTEKFLIELLDKEHELLKAMNGIIQSVILPRNSYLQYFFDRFDNHFRSTIAESAAKELIQKKKLEKQQADRMEIDEQIANQPLEKTVLEQIKSEVQKALKHNSSMTRIIKDKDTTSKVKFTSNQKKSQQQRQSRSRENSKTRNNSKIRINSGVKNNSQSRNNSNSRDDKKQYSDGKGKRTYSKSPHPSSRTKSDSKNWRGQNQNQGPGQGNRKHSNSTKKMNTKKHASDSSVKL